MFKLKIKRSEWGRGKPHKSLLYNPQTEELCCLGMLCEQVGIPRKHMAGLGSPQNLADYLSQHSEIEDGRKLCGKIPRFLLQDRTLENTKECVELMSINDSSSEWAMCHNFLNEEQREQALAEEFLKNGVAVEYTD